MFLQRRVKEIVKLFLGIGLLLLFMQQVKWENFVETLVSANVPLLTLGIGLTCLNMFIAAYRWHVLLNALDAHIRYRKVAALIFVSMFFNTLLPGGFAGDIVRGVQTKGEGITFEHAFSSVLTDRMLGLLSLLLLSTLGIFFQWGLVKSSGLTPYFFLASAAILILTTAMYSRRTARKVCAAIPWAGKIGEAVRRINRSLCQYRNKLDSIAAAFGISILSHLLMFTSIYCLALSLDAHISFTYFVLFLPLIGILSMLPVTIGGLGLRELGFLLFFPLVGMTKVQALGTSLLFFSATVVVALAGASIYLKETLAGLLTHAKSHLTQQA